MTRSTKEHRPVNRMTRSLLSVLVAGALLLAPTAAGASDENIIVATNETAGASVVEAGVQYRIAPNGVVDEENRAYAAARCTDCQTVAAAFQIVLVTRDYRTFVPQNEAFAANVECEACLTWASAKQIIVVTGGPASLSGIGHQRMKALEGRIEALEPFLSAMTLVELQDELNDAFAELLDIASTEVVLHDGSPADAEIAATRQS
jgi:putative peptide zinc metalloprotease protein